MRSLDPVLPFKGGCMLMGRSDWADGDKGNGYFLGPYNGMIQTAFDCILYMACRDLFNWRTILLTTAVLAALLPYRR